MADLFRRKSKHSQQFDHDFDHHLYHRLCGPDLHLNLKSPLEVFDASEDVDKGILAIPDVHTCLADAGIVN